MGDSISVVIPSLNRGGILIRSVSAVLELEIPPDEIIVIDQTPAHDQEVEIILRDWHKAGHIVWIRSDRPSITAAMNVGLRLATSTLVSFLDDDVVPFAGLIHRHRDAHEIEPKLWATVGQVIQPWQQAEELEAPQRQMGLRKDFDFPFNSTLDADVENVMAGNLCVNRARALSIGGFDENFTGSAYRFETDFARRVVAAGGKIRFIGGAGLKHLRVQEGGTRSEGSHLTSSSPKHGFGDYYYSYLHGKGIEGFIYRLHRLVGEVCTKFHLTHPWWIPVKLLGEIRAWRQGKRAAFGGVCSRQSAVGRR